MEKPVRRVLYWTPRVLCIAFAAFISIFAADVFEHAGDFWHTALALLMHLIPTFIVIAVLVASWRREWIGGILFFALAALYVIWAWNRSFFGWTTFLLIPGPLLLAGALFLLNWRCRAELRTGA